MELVKQGSTDLVAPPANWGAEGLSTRDLIIARVRTLQAISGDVSNGKGSPGDMLNSITGEMLAKKGQPLELLPILSLRFWTVYEKVGVKTEYRDKYVMTESNQDQPKEFVSEDGKMMLRQQCLTFLCLQPSKLTKFPLFVDFQRTNLQAGRNLSTIMQENSFAGQPGCARTFSLVTEVTTYNKNSWFIQKVSPVRNSTEEEQVACFKWYQTFKAKEAVQTDEEIPSTGTDAATDNGVF